MDTKTFQELYTSMEVIRARQALLQMKVNDFPNLKKEERQKMFKDFYRKAFPKELRQDKVLTTAELAGRLGVDG